MLLYVIRPYRYYPLFAAVLDKLLQYVIHLEPKETDMPKKQYDKKDALTMTVDEVAEALGVSKYLVWEMIRRNEIRSIKLGKLRRIPRAALMELLEGSADERKEKPSG